MTQRKQPRGLSLVEAMIAMVVIGVIGIVMIGLMQRGGKGIVSAQDQFQAAELLDYIQSRMQLANFDHVFAVDSDVKGGVTAGNFQPHQYWVRWSSSPIRTTLEEVERRMKAAGFGRYRIEVKYIRRDAADNFSNSSVVDFIAFDPLTTCSVAAGCADRFNPDIKFQHLVNNTPVEYFYDVVGSTPEVPNTHMKLLDVYLYKKDAQVMSREGIMLSRERLSGQATEVYTDELKMLITFPIDSSRYYRDRAEAYYGYATGAGYTAGSLIGAGALTGKFFQRRDYGRTSSWSWQLQPGDKTNPSLIPRVAGYSERDAIISLWTSTTPYPPGGAPNYEWTVTADNGAFNNPWSGAFADAVYEEGLHGFVYRARKGRAGHERFSPWKIVYVNTDITPPNARSAELVPLPGAVVNTRSPFIKAFLRDEDSGFLIPAPNAPPKHLPGVSGIATESISVATMATAAPAFSSEIGYIRCTYAPIAPPPPVVSASGTVVVIDTGTMLPYVYPDNQDVHMRLEFGDKTGHKAIKTWSFNVIDMNFNDASSPDVLVPSTAPPMLLGAPLSLTVTDPESGVNWHSFELFDVDRGVVLLSSTTSPSLGLCLNPEISTVLYTTSAFTRGTHQLRVTVANWSYGPGTNATTVRNFDFVVQ